MKDYELSVVFHPDLEMNLDPALDKVKKIIEQNGGKITKEENDGKKRLMYPIKGQDFAIYYYFDVALPAEAPAKISTTFNITDEILRYLLVRTDERKAKLAAKDKNPEEDDKSTEEKGE
jgi:small subunit ribosomal protein S6